jgi:hypothetical protein
MRLNQVFYPCFNERYAAQMKGGFTQRALRTEKDAKRNLRMQA